MLTLPIHTEQRHEEWQNILHIAHRNSFPRNLITNLKHRIQQKLTQPKTHTTSKHDTKWKTFKYMSPQIRKITPYELFFIQSYYKEKKLISEQNPGEPNPLIQLAIDPSRKGHQGECCSCTTVPRLTGHLQSRRHWPTWASNVLITHPILQIWLRRTTTCSLY
jgi:hypothetical protein